MPGLEGRTAFVTGAAGGIGQAIVAALAEAGANVAVADLNGEAAGTVARSAAGTGPGTIFPVQVDISSSTSVQAALAEVTARLGDVDILVNNAAIDVIEPFVESTEDTWRRIIDVNYLGTVIVTRAVLDGMLARSFGRIVNIASDAGRVGASGEVVYSGTKGAVIAFGKALAREVAKTGVTVNAVCPGPTRTPLLQQVADRSPRMMDAIERSIPMRRLGTPQDVAPAVVFFAGPGADFITGQSLSVSGGLTMS
jgi:2-hydroxycyclohexanecarboxyl-CoA dehydrogenase